ncbi:MAG: type III-B CRISPR module RAMP protein Cmr1 [Candidatus Firestonebacteria bacterium]|nr:type III-B CRISPR module RAMP protein Cmr1 [Candidatus Firestonebacteria bacterium]
MEKLTVTLKTVTPLFLGGADPKCPAELRASSIKGALRFWYRAIDPEYIKNEPKIFGSTEHGQGCFGIKIISTTPNSDKWNRTEYGKLDVKENINGKEVVRNGINYLGFPLDMKREGNKIIRNFIPFGKEIKLYFPLKPNIKDEEKDKIKKALLSSIWLLGHIGGLGSRSRRGFGTVALHEWNWNGASITELNIINKISNTPEKWLENFKKELEKIIRWYPGINKSNHTVINHNTKFYLFKKGEKVQRENDKTYKPWEMALFKAGMKMQEFRQRMKLGDKNSDYHRVKAHLAKKYPDATYDEKKELLPRQVLDFSPKRVSFGLPLTFRYNSVKRKIKNNKGEEIEKPVSTTFIGADADHERSASPIHIRIVEINNLCYPLYIKFDAPIIKNIKEEKDSIKYTLSDSNILDKFCNEKLEPCSIRMELKNEQ